MPKLLGPGPGPGPGFGLKAEAAGADGEAPVAAFATPEPWSDDVLMPAVILAMCVGALLVARRGASSSNLRGERRGDARRRRAGVLVAGLVAVTVGCSRSTPQPASSASASSPSSASASSSSSSSSIAQPEHAPLSWGDSFDHLVVTASGAPGAAGTSASPDEPLVRAPAGEARGLALGRTVLRAVAPPVGKAPAEAGTSTVEHLDGSSNPAQVPAESLLAVVPADDRERELLAGVVGVALIVIDIHGVVGPPGARYLMHDDVLVELGPNGTPDETGTDVWTEDREAAFLDALRSADGVVSVTPVVPGVAAVATSGDRSAIESLPEVAGVADDTLLDYAEDPREAEQWVLANTGSPDQAGGWVGVAGADADAARAWRVSEGSGVLVAVIDSGVDLGHPDLAGRLWSNPADDCGDSVDDDRNGRVDDCRGWDFGVGDADPSPDAAIAASDHGTHVAGIIAAGRNDVGVVGVAPSATVMPLKVSSATGAISSSAVYAAVVYAADHGAKVINISLATRPGTARSSVSSLERAVTYARAAGVLIVVGAGNDGLDISARSRSVWPASFSVLFDNVIAVGATTNTDARASFSNYGDPTTIYAPGWQMISTVPGSSYGFKSGTSQAAPVVAGAAADVIASGLAVSPRAVRTRLLATAAITAAGFRVDIAAAVGVAPDPVVQVAFEGIDRLAPNRTSNIDVRVSARNMTAPVAKVRLSIAAAIDYEVFAVEGVSSNLSAPGSTTTRAITDVNGAFPPISVTDPSLLAGPGWVLSAALALPRGDYALIAELLDISGAALGPPQASFVSVGGGLPVTSTTVVPTTDPGGSTTTDPAGGGSGTTVDPAAPTTTNAGSAGTTTPEGSGTTVDGSTGTTSPAGTMPDTSGPDITGPGSSGPDTSGPDTSGPDTSGPVTTSPESSTTEPASATSTTDASAEPTTTLAGSTPTTTPPSPVDSQGIYRITSMSPRFATVDAPTNVVIIGRFPTTIPVYVWFGDMGIVPVTSTDGTTLSLSTPTVLRAEVVDVIVKFTLDTSYQLTLVNAFTFGIPSPGSTSPSGPTSTGPATTVSGVTVPPTTTPGTATSVGAATTVAGSVATTVPGATATTSIGATTTTPATATTSPTAGIALRRTPATGAMTRLDLSVWPRPGCATASCPAVALP